MSEADRWYRLAREASRDGRKADADFYRQVAIGAKLRAGRPAYDHNPIRPFPAPFQSSR
jgi:hypothetical protein